MCVHFQKDHTALPPGISLNPILPLLGLNPEINPD